MEYRFKKIPVTIITVSVLLILYSFLVRGYDPWGDDVYSYVITEIEVPLTLYTVDFILFESSYTHTLLVLFMLLGIGIYFFLFQEDENIISGLKAKKRILLGHLNSVKHKISKPVKGSNGIKENKQIKSYFPSIKFVGISILLLIVALLIGNYWVKLSNTSAPLSLWEAFFLSYGKMIFTIGLLTGGWRFIQYLRKDEQTVKKPESFTHINVDKGHYSNTSPEESSVLKIPWYRNNWILIIVGISFVMIAFIFSYFKHEQSSLTDVELKPYVGMNINDEELQNLFQLIKSDPVINRFDDSYYYTFYKGGLSFHFTTEDKVQAIFIYSGNYKYNQFPGILPNGLNFVDSRNDIEAKLGVPAKKGEGDLPYWSSWNEGVMVTYKGKQAEGENNEIDYITVF